MAMSNRNLAHNSETTKYIRKIRNQNKRAYAEAYAYFLLHGGNWEPDRFELSYMAAQAVRIELHKLVKSA